MIEQEVTVGDDRQKVAIQVEKQDAENGATVEGAVFGIYNKDDIKADGKVIVKADTLLQEMTSDKGGSMYAGSATWTVLCKRVESTGRIRIF